MSFWDIVWFIVISFAFVAYLMVLFSIIGDLFRDPDESGVMKAVWIVALIFFPFITALVYLIARGKGMAERQAKAVAHVKREQDAYIREVAGTTTPTDQIAQARSMMESGVITPAEYERLKEKALA